MKRRKEDRDDRNIRKKCKYDTGRQPGFPDCECEKCITGKLPKDMDYSQIYGLPLEAVEKLNKIKPLSIGQASRISGVSPADISMLAVWLMHEKGE